MTGKTPKAIVESGFLYISNNFKIPKTCIDSNKPGPRVCFVSGIHGDEIAGSIILQKVMNNLKKTTLKCGAVLAYTSVNQTGRVKLTREVPDTGEDLNRLFPGKPDGTLGEKVCFELVEDIKKFGPDLVVDIHNDDYFSIPYIMVDHNSNNLNTTHKKTLAFAEKTNFPVVEERPDEGEYYKNSLSAFFLTSGVPSFTLETGPDKIISQKNKLLVVHHIVDLLQNVNILPRKFMSKLLPSFRIKKVFYNGFPITSNFSGLVEFAKKPGDRFKKGELLATVRDENGITLEKVLAKQAGLILGHLNTSVVKNDGEIFWLAYTEKEIGE
jgi:predicted deacylase